MENLFIIILLFYFLCRALAFLIDIVFLVRRTIFVVGLLTCTNIRFTLVPALPKAIGKREARL